MRPHRGGKRFECKDLPVFPAVVMMTFICNKKNIIAQFQFSADLSCQRTACGIDDIDNIFTVVSAGVSAAAAADVGSAEALKADLTAAGTEGTLPLPHDGKGRHHNSYAQRMRNGLLQLPYGMHSEDGLAGAGYGADTADGSGTMPFVQAVLLPWIHFVGHIQRRSCTKSDKNDIVMKYGKEQEAQYHEL